MERQGVKDCCVQVGDLLFCYVDEDFYIDNTYRRVVGHPSYDKYSVYYTQNELIYDKLHKQGCKVSYLSSVINNGGSSETLYDLYSIKFEGSCSDTEMIILLLKGYLSESSETMCIVLNDSFTWFRVENSKILILGTEVFSQPHSMYSCGSFLKRLNKRMVETGCSLRNIYYTTWDTLNGYWSKFLNIHIPLKDYFNDIKGLRGYDLSSIMSVLSNNQLLDYKCSSLEFTKAFAESSETLNLRLRNGKFLSKHSYFKDYSICTSNVSDIKGCVYGIILDCEGVKGSDGSLQNGVSQVGGIIFCRYNSIMQSIYTFVANIDFLEVTFYQVVESFKAITGKNIPKNGIPTFVFGKSDRVMLKYTIDKFTKRGKKYVGNKFDFHDCTDFILNCKGLEQYTGKCSLSSIAKELGVRVIVPRHNALADARTLFNVLSFIIKEDKDE